MRLFSSRNDHRDWWNWTSQRDERGKFGGIVSSFGLSQGMLRLIAHLAYLSFTAGKFPSRFKTASVTLLLKKPHLDESLPSSYRPISNLNFISKILERLFLQRIQPHILASPNYNQHQSAYRPGHSTETALVHLLDNIYHAADHGKATLLFPVMHLTPSITPYSFAGCHIHVVLVLPALLSCGFSHISPEDLRLFD